MIRINNINKGRKSFKILALLLIQPDVKEVFSNTAATFKTWIAGKIASILS